MRTLGSRCALLAFSVGLVATPASRAELDRTRFMPVDEIRPGMTGVGYSVFSNDGRQSFRVEIIDVMRKSGPNRDLILAELEGAVVNEAGIIAGMSGSPVYIDDRLVGAVAYGWSFAKRPIAGITPIGEMLEVMTEPVPEHTYTGMAPSPTAPLPIEIANPEVIRRGGTGTLSPLSVPLLASGLGASAVSVLSDTFAPLGIQVVQGASGGETTLEEPSFGPGDPVSIPLIRGDASVAVFGTITYADGDRLVAFGHPVFHMGGQRLPLAGGKVMGVLPSQVQSFKFSSSAEPIGYFFTDRTPGAAGRIGDPPPMLPVTLTMRSPWGEEVYAYEVVRDRFLTAPLLQSISMNTLSSRLNRSGLGTMRTDVRVFLNDGAVIEHTDIVATINAPEMLAFHAAGPVSQLINNPYVEPSIQRLEIETRLDEGVAISAIDRVDVLTTRIHPGDRIQLRLLLRPYRGDMKTITMSVEVPASTPPGPALVKVCDRVSLNEWDRERSPDKYRPRNYGDFLSQIRDFPAHNQITARLYARGSALIVAGRELPALPPSVAGALQSVSVTGQRSLADGIELAHTTIELDEHIVGCHTLAVEVEAR